MKELIRLAWRNIWRNRRRSIITIASIFFAVFFAIIMRSIQLGTYGHMITQSIEKYSGYLQVQHPDYFEEKSLDNALDYSEELINELNDFDGIRIAVPRIEGFLLASSGHQSKGVMVSGIDVEKEVHATDPENNLVHYRLTSEIVSEVLSELSFTNKQKELLKLNENSVYADIDRLALDLGMNSQEFEKYKSVFENKAAFGGRYLSANDDGVLVSYRLSKFLGVRVGDTVVLMGSGFHGASAAGLFPVRGIVKVPSPELDNKLVYMTLSSAQYLFNMDGKITSVAINLNNNKNMYSVQAGLQAELYAKEYVVKNWEEVNPVLKQQIDGDDVSGRVFVGILYFIVFFGILGTVMMMIAERKREFGVLVAIGMRKRKLATIVIIEMFFIGVVGTIAGMLSSLPLVIAFNINPVQIKGEMAKTYEEMGFDPIMPTASIDHYFTWQGIIILLMVFIACYMPLRKIRKMKVINSLKG